MEKRKQPSALEADDILHKRLRPHDAHPCNYHDTSIAHSHYINHPFAPWLPMIARPQGVILQQDNSVSSTTTPTSVRLQGHTGAVHTCSFSPSGRGIASAGADKSIYLWKADGSGDHYGIIRGRHLGAILDIHWSRAENMLLTASADGTCGAIDAQTGERISTFRGHTAIVTCCASTKCGPELTASGSIDGSIKIWDRNSPGIAESINLRRQYSVSSVAFSSTSDILFIAGSSHDIAAYDRRAMRVVYSLSGHIGAVTGIRLSPDGTRLLSSSMDNTVRIWDVSPYCDPSNHQLRILGDVTQGTDGHKTRPAWSNDGHLVGSGAANGNVRIWDVQTGQTIHTLSGYQAYVNQIDFHPEERKVVSCSTDKTLILQSHIHL